MDEDNEDDMTHSRLGKWVSKLKEEIEIITTIKKESGIIQIVIISYFKLKK